MIVSSLYKDLQKSQMVCSDRHKLSTIMTSLVEVTLGVTARRQQLDYEVTPLPYHRPTGRFPVFAFLLYAGWLGGIQRVLIFGVAAPPPGKPWMPCCPKAVKPVSVHHVPLTSFSWGWSSCSCSHHPKPFGAQTLSGNGMRDAMCHHRLELAGLTSTHPWQGDLIILAANGTTLGARWGIL